MPELIRNWTFDANADGWTVVTTNGTGAYVASGGVTTGYLNVNVTGRNKTDDGHWIITTTFEALGVPAGATITGYGLCSYYGRCLVYNVVDYAHHGDLANTEGAIFINDGTARILIPSQPSYTSTTAWAQTSNNPNITGLSLPSTTSIEIHANHDIDLGNNAAAQAQIGWDNISITVIYNTPAQNLTDSITLTKSATATTQRLLEALGTTTISSSNTLNLNKTLDALVSYLLNSNNSLDTTRTLDALVSYLLSSALTDITNGTISLGEIINVILTLSKSHNISNLTATQIIDVLLQLSGNNSLVDIVSSILYAQGVYLATAQDLAGTKQKQIVETWTDTQVTWTTVQGGLPLDTALEHSVVTGAGDIAWSPYTVILTGSGTFNAALLINKSAGIAFLRYFDITSNTVITSEYSLSNIPSLVSTLLLDLGLTLTDQETANLVTSLAMSLDTTNTFELANALVTSKSLNITSLQDFISQANAIYNTQTVITSILEELYNRNISIDVNILLTNLANVVLSSLLTATASATFSKSSRIVNTSTLFGQIVGTLVLNQVITQEYATTLIANALIQLNKQNAVAVIGNFIADLAVSLSSTLEGEFAATIITSALIQVLQSTTLTTDSLSGIVVSLALSGAFTVEETSTLISTLAIELANNYSDEYSYQFIAQVFVTISKSIDINQDTQLIVSLLLSLQSSYRNFMVPLGFAIEFLALNTSISINTLNTLITTVILELSKTLTDEQISTFITTIVFNLASNQNIEEARSVAKFGILALIQSNSIESATQLIVQVYTILQSDLTYTNTRSLTRLASLMLSTGNVIELNAVGNYLASILFSETTNVDTSNIATLQGSISMNALVRTVFHTLFENDARISLSYSITSLTTAFAQLFSALELIFSKDVSNQAARLVFAYLDTSLNLTQAEQSTLNALATMSLDYDSSLLNTLTADIRTAISLSAEQSTSILSSLVITGELNLNKEIQDILNATGIINSELQITNALSLQLLNTAILNAGIEFSNVVVVETKFGFDLYAQTPDARIFVLRVDNRTFTVTFEDRTKIPPSEDRTKIIPGKS